MSLALRHRINWIALGMTGSARMESSLEDMELTLAPGDFMMLYTDGITEETDKAGEELGIEGLMEVMRRCSNKDALNLLQQIDAFVTQFRAGKPQGDDITIVCVKVL